MSWRSNSSLQPARKSAQAARRTFRVSEALIFIAYLGHKLRADTFEKLRGIGQIKFCVGGFDADKKAVIAGALEAFYGEQRAMRLRELVQREHTKQGKGGRAENRQFECDRNERGPAIKGTTGDVHRIRYDVDSVLEEKSGQTAADTTEQRKLRNKIMPPALQTIVKTARLGKPRNWERRERVKAFVTGFADFSCSGHQGVRRIEFADHAVESDVRLGAHSCSSDLCATNSRISAMEIAGNPRTKRKSKETNRPIVPMNVLYAQ